MTYLLAAGLAVGALVLGWYGTVRLGGDPERESALRQAREGSGSDTLPGLLRVLDRCPEDAEVLAAVADHMIRSGRRVAEVEPYADRLVAVRPEDPAARRMRLDLKRRLDKRDEALTDAVRLLELDPADQQTRRAVVALAADVGRYELAEHEAIKLLEVRPEDRTEVGTLLARVYLDAGRPEKAREALAQFVPPDTTFWPAHVIRGVLHYEDGQYEEAVRILRAPSSTDTTEGAFARYYLALSLARLGRRDEADALFGKLGAGYRAERLRADAAQQPDSQVAQVRAAEALLEAGRAGEARQLLENSLTRFGPDRTALTLLARCYDALGLGHEAEDVRRRAATAHSR